MNNNITEDYVSFEVAKLLNKAGLPGLKVLFPDDEKHWKAANLEITQARAVKWIRENFGIICTHTMPTKINNKWLFGGKVFSMENEADNMVIGAFNSPEKAIEAALLHTLKKLIP